MDCPKCTRGGTGPHPAFCTPEMRFWRRVVKSDRCWEWQGASHPFGYGLFRLGGGSRSRTIKHYTHRYSWELHNGLIPDGSSVLHHCDNPRCVRPDHLFLGTQSDNVADMHAKGRQVHQPRKTHCIQNHAFVGTNIMRGKGGTQKCRECNNAPRRKGLRATRIYKARRTA